MIRSYSPERTQFISSCTRRTGYGCVSVSSRPKRISLSQPGSQSTYSLACLTNASRLSLREAVPADMTISVWQVLIGLRVTSVAARSQLSSAARYHSSSAIWIASSG